MDNKDGSKIVKYQKSFHLNIAAFLLMIIIVYVLFHVYSSLTKKEVLAYEVTLGNIVEKNYYQGFAIRDELVITADKAGYVHYLQANKSRVGAKSRILGLDQGTEIASLLEAEKTAYRRLGSSELRGITPQVESFLGSVSEVDFSVVYGFNDDVSDYLYDVLAKEMSQEFSDKIEIAKAGGTYTEYAPYKPGFLVYTLDGFENKDIAEITPEDFNQGGKSVINLRSNSHVEAGDPLYKLVLSDDWSMLVPVSHEYLGTLSQIDAIRVRFTQDNAMTWATCEMANIGGAYYLLLKFDDSMERYADKRIINIELLFEETAGLKIPNTAITEKSFFTIPRAYFYLGNNSKELGVLISRPDTKNTFETPTIYYATEEYYYVDDEFVKEGDVLLMENSRKSYVVGSNIDILTGAFNINKGYAVFKPIEILYQNEKYTIVKTKTSYGLSLYDHIALNAGEIEGNEIL